MSIHGIDVLKHMIINVCKYIIRKLENTFSCLDYQNLPDLTATSNAENMEECKKALDTYLARPTVHEIGITAPYAGGKSSFIQTYFKNHGLKVTYVSLATFLNSENKSEEDESDGEKLRSIELSILQQLSVSNIKVKHKWNGYLYSFVLCVAFVSVFFFKFNDKNYEEYLLELNVWEYSGLFSIIFLSISFGGLFLIVKDLSKIVSNYDLQKFSILKGEFELNKVDSGSIFNKHLSDILQHFIEYRIHIVVFEDLDRLDNQTIFLKLKELNTLINECDKIKSKICFIYAISDDVFERYDRTKFFDAIISLIPATNTHKSTSLP